MAQLVLAVNAGSSSLKCALFRAHDSLERLVAIEVTNIGDSGPALFKTRKGSEESREDGNAQSHGVAFKRVLQHIQNIKDIPDIRREDGVVIAHRIVHGGDSEHEVAITDETYHYLEKLEQLAPLHNAPGLAIIKTCQKVLPAAKNMAFFDSTFHASLPAAVKSYAIDPKVAKEKGLRKYGFHGISYQSILRSVSMYLNKSQQETNLIVLHIGSGASVCAIRMGKSIDTSMGLTPVSGLPGSSRSGDVDPSLIFHYISDAAAESLNNTKELHITKAEGILNKESGWRSLTGTSDFSKIGTPSAQGANRLAFEILVDRIVGFVGSYYTKLDGKVDAMVFSGGIGERSAYLRAEVASRCQCLGFAIDMNKNKQTWESGVFEVSHGSKHKVLVCHTDEEAEMAGYFCKKAST